MRIMFVARHESGDNDDEGALTHALRELGHDVICVHEKDRHRTPAQRHLLERGNADLCLFLKWPDRRGIATVARRMPCAYWHFDLIDGTYDETLRERSEHRMRWCRDAYPHVVAGFHTDGDWVASEKLGGRGEKLHHLPQGADERVAGPGTEDPTSHHPDVLFMGMVNHGMRRASHIAHLHERWGSRFAVLGDGGPHWRIHGRRLADYLAGVKIVIAPDGPGSDRYWSNRVVLTLGFGGFLLHPYCEGLRAYYDPAIELQTYRDRDHCDELIGYYLDRPESRAMMARRGHEATIRGNLYRHRVEAMLKTLEGKL